MCKCVLQRQPSEGSWEHPSQPINTLKDPAGWEREKEIGTDFPLKQLEEKAETQGQCSRGPAGTEATLRSASMVPLPRVPDLPQDRMAAAHCDSGKMGGTNTHTVVTQEWQCLQELRGLLGEAVVLESLSLSNKGFGFYLNTSRYGVLTTYTYSQAPN